MKCRRKNSALCAVVIAAIAGCAPYTVRTVDFPATGVPDRFVSVAADGSTGDLQERRVWWREFQDEKLDRLIEIALSNNYSLKVAWSRLRQAREQAVISGSAQYPQVDVTSGASRTRIDNDEAGFSSSTGGFLPGGDAGGVKSIENEFFVRSGLSFEIDLWRRIASARQADEQFADSVEADAENTALLLTGAVAELWFRAQEQKALLNLLEEQLEAGQKQLDLIELRFAVGQGTALDVLQQRQQLDATRTGLPIVRSALEQSMLQLSTLLGLAPGNLADIQPDGELPDLPAFPDMVRPVDLIELRPDLRAAKSRAQSEEFDLASAVADRFPRLAVGLSYDFSTSDVGDLFTREVGRMGADATLPLIDGGRRRARVRQQEARVEELLFAYSDLFLQSLEEVERLIIAERYQQELVQRMEKQFESTEATLRESRSRYVNGLIDYINVLAAFQAVQDLERRLVTERRELLTERTRLYRALGGAEGRCKHRGGKSREDFDCKGNMMSERDVASEHSTGVWHRELFALLRRARKPLIILIIGASLAYLLVAFRASPPRVDQRRVAALVSTLSIQSENVRSTLVGYGTVKASRELEIRPQVAGHVVKLSNNLERGGRVKQDELLLQVDPRDYEIALEGARAQLERAKFELELEKGNQIVAEREWELLKKDIEVNPLGKRLALREPHLREKEAALKAARSQFLRAELDLERTKITSPFPALILEESVEKGKYVSSQNSVARVVATDRFYVEVRLPRESLKLLPLESQEPASEIGVKLMSASGKFGGAWREGEFVRFVGEVDPAGRMATVIVAVREPLEVIDGQLPLLLGSYVKVQLTGREVEDVFAVPAFTIQEGSRVWIVDEDDALRSRSVQIAFSSEERVFVTGDIAAGDCLVTSPVQGALEGLPVRLADSAATSSDSEQQERVDE